MTPSRQVMRKEKAEEAGIERKAAQLAKESSKVCVVLREGVPHGI